MLEFTVFDLQPGMTFNKPLLDTRGSRLAPPNSPISEDEISLLKKWGIEKIQTEGVITSGHLLERKDDSKENKEVIKKINTKKLGKAEKVKLISLYDEWIEHTTDVLKNLSMGMKLEKSVILNLVDQMILTVPKNKDAFLSLIQVKNTEEYIFGHSLNMSILAIIIGSGLAYSNINLRLLGMSVLLCDVGMLKIPKHIREKKYALTESDIKLIKTHPLHTYRILTNYGQLDPTIISVGLQHHESYDGKGYPKGLSGSEIHDFAKITAVADSYDAMTKKRSYRKEKIPHNIMKELLKSVNKRIDPKIMKIFLNYMAIYPVGSAVQLESKEIGLVISANENNPLKPVLKILYNSKLEKLQEEKIMDLLEETDNKIVGVIDPKELGISIVNEI